MRRLPVAVRVALVSTAVLFIAVLLGIQVFRSTLRSEQIGDLDRGIDRQVATIKALATAGPIPSMLTTERDSPLFCQIVLLNGQVIGASANVSDMHVMVPMDSALMQGGPVSRAPAVIDRVDVRLTKVALTTTQGPAWALVAAPLKSVREADSSLVRQLRVSGPLVVLLAGLGVWLVARRALRPVEELRRQVDAIGAADLAARVTEPEAKDEIGRLSATMNRLLDRLQDSHERQARFVGDASHELRSPLATVRTRLEVGLRAPDRTDWPMVAEASLRQTNRMERLVEDLLLLARTDDPTPSSLMAVDLDEIIQDEVISLRLISALPIDTARVSAGRVSGNPDDLRRVVVNLVNNALGFAKTTVQLSLQMADSDVVFTVDDDGPGIPADQRARMFDRFTQLDESRARSRSGGAGLGLAIVAEVVRRHHGAVAIVESPLGGARVVVTIPAAE